jgi:TRAP transporter 4TM/12TM fusion protein
MVEKGKPGSPNWLAKLIPVIGGILALYELVIASRVLTWFGVFLPAAQHRAISLFFALILIYALNSLSGKTRQPRLTWYDLLFLACGLVGAGYVAFNYEAVVDYSTYGYLDTFGIVITLVLAVSLFEASRRLIGWSLIVIIFFFGLITIFQNYLPGLLYGKGFPLDRLTYSVFVGSSGIFGTPLGVAVTIIITYIIFGRLLQQAGGGQWFINIALSITGWMRGGPAKATIVASCLFGMISGSPSASVATIGVISIPMMMRVGYPAKFAGAVEAVAGVGGQFMPPVMGAIAFIMAEWLNIPYSKIAIAAFMPAVLYYLVLYMSIHFEAKRLDLKAIPRSELPSLLSNFKKGWYYLLPLATLIYFLVIRSYPPEMAGLYCILVLIGVSFLVPEKEKHLGPRQIWNALVGSTKSWLITAGVTATVGMLISSLELSGLGIKFSSFILSISQGNLFLTLVLVGIASFILGTGLDSIPCYMTLAVLTAPALVELGVDAMTAHLFIIYWGLAAHITPPSCTPVFVACGISGGKIWETGWEAVRLGIAVYVVSFAFVYNPALLARGTALQISLAFVTAAIGSIFVAAAIRSFTGQKLHWLSRGLLFGGGLFLIGPTLFWSTLLGFGLGVAGIFYGLYATKKVYSPDSIKGVSSNP